MNPKLYVIAVKGERESSVAPDWVNRLRKISGVRVTGETHKHAVVQTDLKGINLIRATLGDDLLFGEQIRRTPQSR